MFVRPTQPGDLPAILAILNREILEGVAHFGLEAQSLEDLRTEVERAHGTYHWFSALENEEVVGFARTSPWKSRGAYAQTVEIGVYASKENQSKGVGTALYEQIIPATFAAGIHTILAGIRLPNDPCVRLHEKFGFKHVGVFPEVGFKFGEWHDVGYWALTAADKSASR